MGAAPPGGCAVLHICCETNMFLPVVFRAARRLDCFHLIVSLISPSPQTTRLRVCAAPQWHVVLKQRRGDGDETQAGNVDTLTN